MTKKCPRCGAPDDPTSETMKIARESVALFAHDMKNRSLMVIEAIDLHFAQKDPPARRTVETVLKGIRNSLQRIRSDIHHFTDILRLMTTPRTQHVNVHRALTHVLAVLRAPVREKQISVCRRVANARVLVDPRDLEFVLLKVLANAFTYTNNATTVTIESTVDHDSDDVFHLDIRDSGPGFRSDVLEMIGKNPTGASSRGRGFSLFLSSALLRANGGDLQVSNVANTHGKGANVRISLRTSD